MVHSWTILSFIHTTNIGLCNVQSFVYVCVPTDTTTSWDWWRDWRVQGWCTDSTGRRCPRNTGKLERPGVTCPTQHDSTLAKLLRWTLQCGELTSCHNRSSAVLLWRVVCLRSGLSPFRGGRAGRLCRLLAGRSLSSARDAICVKTSLAFRTCTTREQPYAYVVRKFAWLHAAVGLRTAVLRRRSCSSMGKSLGCVLRDKEI